MLLHNGSPSRRAATSATNAHSHRAQFGMPFDSNGCSRTESPRCAAARASDSATSFATREAGGPSEGSARVEHVGDGDERFQHDDQQIRRHPACCESSDHNVIGDHEVSTVREREQRLSYQSIIEELLCLGLAARRAPSAQSCVRSSGSPTENCVALR